MNQLKRHQWGRRRRALSNCDVAEALGSFLAPVCLGSLLLLAPPLLAQQAPPTVMAGTRLRVKFGTPVGTATSREGDGVEVQLLKPVEAEGREVLPVGSIITGRVLAVRKGDTHRKIVPVLRLAFDKVRLPDGRTCPANASLAGLGVMESVDSEGAATPTPNTKSENAAAVAGTAGVGAGVGAISGGGSGVAKGAAIGAGIGLVGDLLTRNEGWEDFTLSKGRKAWLRLDDDLTLTSAAAHVSQKQEIQSPPATSPLPQGSGTASASATPPQPENTGVVYVEPAPKARLHRVNTEAIVQDFYKAGVPLSTNPSHADYVLRVWDDSRGFHAILTGPNGLIAWAASAHTQGGITRGVLRYLREHAPQIPQP